MIETRSIVQLLEDNRVDACGAAIVETFASLTSGVSIVRHPGKLDVSDVLKGDVVSAPGVMVGWTSQSVRQDLDGSFHVDVDWSAYVVAEPYVDLVAKRRVEREAVAQAIGLHLLTILQDADTSSWGLTHICPPADKPQPAFKPVFTASSYTKGTVYYAVTWRQSIVCEGEPFFDASPVQQDGDPDTLTLVDGELPPELAALMGAHR